VDLEGAQVVMGGADNCHPGMDNGAAVMFLQPGQFFFNLFPLLG
jgi:hypothetical protein